MKCFLLSLFFPLFLLAEIPYGIVGMGDYSSGSVVKIAFIDSSGNTTLVSPLPTDLSFRDLAINSSGKAIFSGFTNSSESRAYFVSPLGIVTLASTFSNSFNFCCAINNSGDAIEGGWLSTQFPYAQYISSSGNVTTITGLSTSSMRAIKAAAMSDSGNALVTLGSSFDSGIRAYLIPPSGVATTITNLPIATGGAGATACMTPSGLGCLISGNAVRYIVSGTAVSPQFPPSGFSINSDTSSLALNDSGQGIVSGQDINGPVLCTFSLTGPKIQANIPNLAGDLYIACVDISNSSVGVAGGIDNNTSNPFAYFLSPTGTLIPINLPASNISIDSVSINDDNIAFLGGSDGANFQAYLASYSTGVVTPISLPSGAVGNRIVVALTPSAPPSPTPSPSLYFIPTSNLSGNDLKLANYINSYAPSLTSYFIFSNLTQTLPQALQSVAPTRNSFALFSASNTVFSYNYVLSNHSRNNRASYRPFPKEISEEFVTAFFAKKAEPIEEEPTPEIPFIEKPKPLFEMWGQFIGTFAYQKAEGQSPSYDPKTGGFVVGFDHKMEDWCLGIGSAYSYTHVSEGNAGKIHLNQESLFFYSLWNAHCFYIDTALWGGSFQTSSLRKIQMTGYQFQAKSDIWAWQLSPHLEVGYDRSSETKEITIEPYAMFDWVNNWQLRYRERGSGPFNMGQDNHYSSFLRTEVGFRLYEQIDFAHWHLIIQEKGGFVNKKPFQVGTVNAYLIGFPGSFTVETFTTTQNLGVAELELLFVPTNPYFPYGTLSYQGEFGKMYQSHTASLNATWNF